MSLARLGARVPIGVQVGVVAALFVAALVVTLADGGLGRGAGAPTFGGQGLARAGRQGPGRAGPGHDRPGREFPFYREERAAPSSTRG